MEAGEATNKTSRLVGGGGGRWKPTYETNDASASFGAVVVSKTDKKILKKNTPRAQTTQTRVVWALFPLRGPALAFVDLRWPLLAFVGRSKGLRWPSVAVVGCCGPSWACVGLPWAAVGLCCPSLAVCGCCLPSWPCVGLPCASVGLRWPSLTCVGRCWPSLAVVGWKPPTSHRDSLVVVGADGSRPMKQTTRLRRLGPWLSVKRIKKIKKTHIGTIRRASGVVWALFPLCWPALAFVGHRWWWWGRMEADL